MKNGKCIVLVSNSGYSDIHLPLLKNYVCEGIDLFCSVGNNCELWEEFMDNLCVELDISGKHPGAFCTTTSHPNESKEDVIEFASNWKTEFGDQCIIEVIEI